MPSRKKEHIDLIAGIHLRVEGEAGKTNGLAWSILLDLGNHLQELLRLLAKYNLESNFQANLKDFEIELFDFKPGSAVPAFRFKQVYVPSLDDELNQQRVDVSKALERILTLADKGRYEQLKKAYELPEVASDIATELFKFTFSTGTSPISIVRPLRNGKFKTLYKINRPKRSQINALIPDIKTRQKAAEENKSEVYAKIVVKEAPGGKRQNKIKEFYEGKDTAMSFAPPLIVAPNRTYHLHVPIMCRLEKEDDFFIIQAELYDLYAAGESSDQAEQNFYNEFDIAYQHLMSLPDEKLSDRLQRAKTAFKLIVKEILEE